jgi:serine/threonine-protein kinase
MAETFRARRRGSAGVSKQLLIKKIRPELAGDEHFVSMFIQEARISAGLSHGNIAQVFDFGEVNGEYFMVMEYVEGSALSRLVQRIERQGGQLSIPCVLFIASELCKGLHYAHTRRDEEGRPLRIVHRDVTPSNILISYEGQVKVVDFGVAKALHVGAIETQPGVIKGKLSYHAPEQLLGKKDLDARVDLFATGVVLYRLLCGRLPFEGMPQDVMAQTVGGKFAPPRVHRPDVPPELEALVLRAMSVDRDKRPPSAHAMGQELLTLLYASPPAFDALSLAAVMAKAFSREAPHVAAPHAEKKAPPAASEDKTHTISQVPLNDRMTEKAEPAHGGMPRALRRGLAVGLLAVAVSAGSLWYEYEPEPPLAAPQLAPAMAEASTGRPLEVLPAPAALAPPADAPEANAREREGAVATVAVRPPSAPVVQPVGFKPPPAEAPVARKRQGEAASLKEARQLFRAGQYVEARQSLQQLVAAEPTNAQAHLFLGLTYKKQGEPQLASKHLRRFLDLSPGTPRDARIERMINNLERKATR